MSKQLQQAISLIKEGQKREGRQLLVEIVKTEPNRELAWLWLARVANDDEHRRRCLAQVLALNPENSYAQQGWAWLEEQYQAYELAQQPPPSPPAPVETNGAAKLPPEPAPVAPAKPTFQPNRAIWFNPEGFFNRIIMFYDDSIIVANPDRDMVKRLQAALKQGPLAPRLLGHKLKMIPLNKITLVKANKYRKSMAIHYEAGQLQLPFVSKTARDECFAALEAKLSPKLETRVQDANPFQAMIAPLIMLGVISLATVVSHTVAPGTANGMGTLIIGLILWSLALFWLVNRVLRPPVMMILAPAERSEPAAHP